MFLCNLEPKHKLIHINNTKINYIIDSFRYLPITSQIGIHKKISFSFSAAFDILILVLN